MTPEDAIVALSDELEGANQTLKRIKNKLASTQLAVMQRDLMLNELLDLIEPLGIKDSELSSRVQCYRAGTHN